MIDEEIKKEILHPDKCWKTCKNKGMKDGDIIKLIIYNSSITIGGNCSIEFDKLFKWKDRSDNEIKKCNAELHFGCEVIDCKHVRVNSTRRYEIKLTKKFQKR